MNNLNFSFNGNILLEQMLNRQLKNIDDKFKLECQDMQRIVNNLNNDIFGDECCKWNGYVTKSSNSFYVNFFFKSRKLALHRILYINYMGPLDDNSYLKYTCNNKGICCNINHIKINNPVVIKTKKELVVNEYKNNNNNNKDIFIIHFD